MSLGVIFVKKVRHPHPVAHSREPWQRGDQTGVCEPCDGRVSPAPMYARRVGTLERYPRTVGRQKTRVERGWHDGLNAEREEAEGSRSKGRVIRSELESRRTRDLVAKATRTVWTM